MVYALTSMAARQALEASSLAYDSPPSESHNRPVKGGANASRPSLFTRIGRGLRRGGPGLVLEISSYALSIYGVNLAYDQYTQWRDQHLPKLKETPHAQTLADTGAGALIWQGLQWLYGLTSSTPASNSLGGNFTMLLGYQMAAEGLSFPFRILLHGIGNLTETESLKLDQEANKEIGRDLSYITVALHFLRSWAVRNPSRLGNLITSILPSALTRAASTSIVASLISLASVDFGIQASRELWDVVFTPNDRERLLAYAEKLRNQSYGDLFNGLQWLDDQVSKFLLPGDPAQQQLQQIAQKVLDDSRGTRATLLNEITHRIIRAGYLERPYKKIGPDQYSYDLKRKNLKASEDQDPNICLQSNGSLNEEILGRIVNHTYQKRAEDIGRLYQEDRLKAIAPFDPKTKHLSQAINRNGLVVPAHLDQLYSLIYETAFYQREALKSELSTLQKLPQREFACDLVKTRYKKAWAVNNSQQLRKYAEPLYESEIERYNFLLKSLEQKIESQGGYLPPVTSREESLATLKAMIESCYQYLTEPKENIWEQNLALSSDGMLA